MINSVRERRAQFQMADWPEAARAAVLAAFGAPATSNDRRRARGYDRWLTAAAAEGVPADLVSAEIWRRRSEGLSKADADAMRAAVAALPDAHLALFARATPTRAPSSPALSSVGSRNGRRCGARLRRLC